MKTDFLSLLRKGSIEAFSLRVLGAVLIFAMHSVLGRTVGREGYGIFSYALALSGLLAFIVPLGWPTALLRFVAQYREQQNWSLLKGSLLMSHGVAFIGSFVAALVLWGLANTIDILPDMALSLRYAALLLPLLTLVNLRRGALRSLQFVKLSIIPDDIVLPLLVVMGICGFAAANASDVLRIYAASVSVVFLAGMVLLCRSLPEPGRTATPKFLYREWMLIALPMLFGEVGKIIIDRTGVIMLGTMVNMDTVGLYSAANRIAALNVFILWAINLTAAPMLASAYHGNRPDEFRMVVRKAMKWSALWTLPLFVIMVLGAHYLLSIFGTKFSEGAVVLRILAVGQFVSAAAGPVGMALLMSGRERQFAFSTIVIAGGNIVGNFFAIKAYGAEGAAGVSASSIIALNIWQYRLTRSIYSDQKDMAGSGIK